MAVFKFQPTNGTDRTVVSKKVMHRIIKDKDAKIIYLKEQANMLMDENDDLIKYCRKLKHQRKQYLILSVVSTLFGVAGFVAGMCG